MIGENNCLIFGGLVCKGQYHKTNVTKDLGILLYVYSTLYHIDLLLNHTHLLRLQTWYSLFLYFSCQRIEHTEESDSTPKYLFLKGSGTPISKRLMELVFMHTMFSLSNLNVKFKNVFYQNKPYPLQDHSSSMLSLPFKCFEIHNAANVMALSQTSWNVKHWKWFYSCVHVFWKSNIRAFIRL